MLTLICGQARAGKTTLSNEFYTGIVIHLDYVKPNLVGKYEIVNDIVSRLTEDVVVEGLYNEPCLRKRLLEAYKGTGSRCIYLNTPYEIRKSRRGGRELFDGIFIPPSMEEGWDEIIIK